MGHVQVNNTACARPSAACPRPHPSQHPATADLPKHGRFPSRSTTRKGAVEVMNGVRKRAGRKNGVRESFGRRGAGVAGRSRHGIWRSVLPRSAPYRLPRSLLVYYLSVYTKATTF
ncbi:hypothetical protein Bbelb_428650 [Branchiostoma belcheri]|nr:hypothetical protein Bbelb_428650 [Branchiostoma belcheri]